MKLCLVLFFLSILTPNESLGFFVPLYPLHSIGALKKSPDQAPENNIEEQNADLLKLKELIMAETRKHVKELKRELSYKFVHIS